MTAGAGSWPEGGEVDAEAGADGGAEAGATCSVRDQSLGDSSCEGETLLLWLAVEVVTETEDVAVVGVVIAVGGGGGA